MPEPAPSQLVLDTHVWIWAVEGERSQLSAAAMAHIDAAARRGGILIAAISIWELAMLEVMGRVRLSLSVEDWVAAALRAPGTRLLELSPAIAIEGTRLPGEAPRDPADWMLIASARVSGARLATRDRQIVGYSLNGSVAVLDCEP